MRGGERSQGPGAGQADARVMRRVVDGDMAEKGLAVTVIHDAH
jgi:hypothetical protein